MISARRGCRTSLVSDLIIGLVTCAALAVVGCSRHMSREEVETRYLVVHLARVSYYLGGQASVSSDGDIDGFIAKLDEEGFLDSQGRREYPGLAEGRDAWGRKILLSITENVGRFRSRGPDGVDQNGGGDDIEAVVNYKDTQSVVQVTDPIP